VAVSPQTKGVHLSPLTLAELLEVQAEDGRGKHVRAAMDGNDKSRFREHPNGLMMRTAPLDGAAQVYVPTHMRYGVMIRPYHTCIESRYFCGCECLNSRTRRPQGGWHPHPKQPMSR